LPKAFFFVPNSACSASLVIALQVSAAATRSSVLASLAALAFEETHFPYAFLPFLLVPYSANLTGSGGGAGGPAGAAGVD